MLRFLSMLWVLLLVFSAVTGCRVLMDIPDDPEATCGNSSREPGEPCDGTDLGGASCATLGFLAGNLTCAADCTWNTDLCFDADPCGDGTLEDGEECDGTDLGEATCQSLGYYGGALACTADCTWDRTSCEFAGRCGDGILQESESETCDGAELDGQTCVSLDYYGGALACAADCTLDTTSCETVGRCGDGIVQNAHGETCDGAELGGQTCVGLGYYGGTLACAADCTLLLAPCVAAGRCGDGILQAAHDETCDGASLDGETCVTQGYYGGTLACAADCSLNLTSCMLAGRCGDGIVQDAHGETCDGPELNGQTCNDLGYCGGTLSCKSTCIFQTVGCSNDMCK